MEQVQVRATIDQIEEFKESMLWLDITDELNAWKEGFTREMSAIVDDAETKNPSTASVLMHMGDLNGRQKAVDYFLSLPDVFLDLIKTRMEAKKDGRNQAD